MARSPISKALIHRQRAADDLLSVLSVHEPLLEERLSAWLAQSGEDLEGLDLKVLLRALRGLERRAFEELVRVSSALATERSDDHAAQRARDEALAHARHLLIDGRRTISAVFGPMYAHRLGLGKGEVPKRPNGVLMMMGTVLHIMSKPDASPPEPAHAGLSMDLAPWKADLEAAHKALDAAWSGVVREAAQAQSTLSQKNAAQARFDQTHRAVVALFNGLSIAAGTEWTVLSLDPEQD
jgi:hypothetical protein